MLKVLHFILSMQTLYIIKLTFLLPQNDQVKQTITFNLHELETFNNN